MDSRESGNDDRVIAYFIAVTDRFNSGQSILASPQKLAAAVLSVSFLARFVRLKQGAVSIRRDRKAVAHLLQFRQRRHVALRPRRDLLREQAFHAEGNFTFAKKLTKRAQLELG